MLFSLEGRLAQALAYYWAGVYPEKIWDENPSAVQHDVVPIFFGRRLWDHDNALVPANFRNLQLKITYNFANVNSVGATGFTTGTGKLTVISKVMEGLEGTPGAFFMHKNHYGFTTAASGDERVDLPNDWPYALLMVRAWESGVDIDSTITNLKLSINQDKIIPFDHSVANQVRILSQIYPMIEHQLRALAADGEVSEAWLGEIRSAVALSEVDSKIVGISSKAAGQLTFSVYTDAGAADTTARAHLAKYAGYLPWNCVGFPFGVRELTETYLQAPEFSSIKLYVTQGNAGAEADIVLSQLRKYE